MKLTDESYQPDDAPTVANGVLFACTHHHVPTDAVRAARPGTLCISTPSELVLAEEHDDGTIRATGRDGRMIYEGDSVYGLAAALTNHWEGAPID